MIKEIFVLVGIASWANLSQAAASLHLDSDKNNQGRVIVHIEGTNSIAGPVLVIDGSDKKSCTITKRLADHTGYSLGDLQILLRDKDAAIKCEGDVGNDSDGMVHPVATSFKVVSYPSEK